MREPSEAVSYSLRCFPLFLTSLQFKLSNFKVSALPAPVCMQDLVQDFPQNAQLAFDREELRVGAVDGEVGTRSFIGSVAELTCLEGFQFSSKPELVNPTVPPPTVPPPPPPYDTGRLTFQR